MNLKKTSGSVFVTIGLCSAALCAIPTGTAFSDEGTQQPVATTETRPYQIHSSLSSTFRPINCGEVKAAWAAPSGIPGTKGEMWGSQGDYAYEYWYFTVDRDGKMVFGGNPRSDEEKASMDQETADKAVRSHLTSFNWLKMKFPWAYEESLISAKVQNNYSKDVNGWNMQVYEGVLEQKDLSIPFCLYSCVSGDTVSWCTVIGNNTSSTLRNVQEEAGRVAQSYRDGSTYILKGGTALPLQMNSASSQNITVDS